MLTLLTKIVAVLTSMVAVFTTQVSYNNLDNTPFLTPTPTPDISATLYTPYPMPTFTPVPPIDLLIAQINELNGIIASYTPEPTPAPIVVYIQITHEPTPMPTPTPTPEKYTCTLTAKTSPSVTPDRPPSVTLTWDYSGKTDGTLFGNFTGSISGGKIVYQPFGPIPPKGSQSGLQFATEFKVVFEDTVCTVSIPTWNQ